MSSGADGPVPEREEDFRVPVSETEIEYLKAELKKLERKQRLAEARAVGRFQPRGWSFQPFLTA